MADGEHEEQVSERVIAVDADGLAAIDGHRNGGPPITEVIEIVEGEVEAEVEEGGQPAAEAESGVPSDAESESDEITAADLGGSDDELTAEDRVVEALPDLARLAAIAATRTAAWGARASLRTTMRLARATVDPVTAAELVQDVSSGVRGAAREFLGISELEQRIEALTPPGDRFANPGALSGPGRDGQEPALAPELALRAQGAELLRQSADVTVDQRLHPAFGRILGELAPDEGRILRLLAYEGRQPVVDVRAANLIGVGSQLVAQNLNMVGMASGVREGDRVPAYLGNLLRLGLVEFSDTPLDDAITYQVLEAQPHVMKAIRAASRAKSVQRSLELTPFGKEFCTICFPREIEEARALNRGEIDPDDVEGISEDGELELGPGSP